jgi:hypothetical protein
LNYSVKEAQKISQTIEFPESLLALGNLALIIWIALDTAALWFYDSTTAIVFAILAFILVFGILRFLGCLRPCYNCKKCTGGMGRLAALYFGKRSLKDYKYSYKLPTAILFYLLIGPIPAAFSVYWTLQAFTIPKAAVSVLLLALCIISAYTWIPQTNKN